ncbi:MAG: hypothetical protein ACK5W9_02600 [Bdellovibrionales bacterium]
MIHSALFTVMFLSLFLISCEKADQKLSDKITTTRNTASLDLYKITGELLSQLNDSEVFNLGTCPAFLQNIYVSGLELDPRTLNLEKTKEDWSKTYENLWLIRLKLKDKLNEFIEVSKKSVNDPAVKACASSIRNSLRLSRYVEDYLAEYYGGEKQDADQNSDFKPVLPVPFDSPAPWTLRNPDSQSITLKSGDLIISRGNAYTSAAISRIVEVDSQFSHMAMIYIPGGPTKEYTLAEAMKRTDILVLEAHIEVGSTIRTFNEYASDGNARNVLFRYKKGGAVPHRAAKSAYDFLEKSRDQARSKTPVGFRRERSDVNYAVPYDFKMDLRDTKEVFCTEVGYIGYKNEGVLIPTFMSDINPKLDLVQRLGIKGNQIFAPGDMELEPQFEIIAEFRNLRKLKGVRMKDMTLSSFLKWMDEGYKIHPKATASAEALSAWLLRQLDINVKNVRKRLPKNMNVKALNTVLVLDSVNSYLESHLVKSEIEFKEKNRGLLITYPYGIELLNDLRVQDKKAYVEGQKAPLHREFRPRQLAVPGI